MSTLFQSTVQRVQLQYKSQGCLTLNCHEVIIITLFGPLTNMDETIALNGDSRKRARVDVAAKAMVPMVPTIDFRSFADHFQDQDQRRGDLRSIAEVYKTHQVVYLPGYLEYIQGNADQEEQKSNGGPGTDGLAKSSPKHTSLCWQDMHSIFADLSENDQKSFCVENEKSQSGVLNSDFLKSNSRNAGYCSFLVQQKESLSRIYDRLPVPSLRDNSICSTAPPGSHTSASRSVVLPSQQPCDCCRCWHYEPCLWVFFGRNPVEKTDEERNSGKDLQGRPEHTDSISHDGTWHYQMSGTKRWLLRPTRQLQYKMHGKYVDTASNAPTTIDCHQGDVLIVNTKLWYHQTILPQQPYPSVSYARDFWISCAPFKISAGASNDSDCEKGAQMTNVDGLYATDEIPEGTIIFREDDMPDCELHRSSINPNCEVVELEDGTQAVVSIRHIPAGEFFCVGESSDEEEGDEGEEGEEEENVGCSDGDD